ncbi:MAG: UDP-N-acetylmuramoyl-tripeptide--D-alanyl-D-alanine ligase [Candidatus Pacebacteria bacterium]|nr:UDP-N-acetylmuramoyl-tripeptide--D-alanyl-D-alanine ligase [Candidatus Paceibacterota bacterium]
MKDIFKKIITAILRWEARVVLKKYKPKIVAITGSVGKTTTKDVVYRVLNSVFYVRKSEKSFNSEIGIPLTILGCENAWNNPFLWIKNIFKGLAVIFFKNHYPKWLVLEVGADSPGDIEKSAKLLKPDIVVMTRFAQVPVHVEFFESPQDLINEKKKLAKYMKEDGILVFNNDDEDMTSIKIPTEAQKISFGYKEGSNIQGMNTEILYKDNVPVGQNFRVEYAGTSAPIILKGVIGKTHTFSALAAIAVGASQNLNVAQISSALAKNYNTQPGRMKILQGIKRTVLIDDSYNSSPIAVQKAVETMCLLEIKEGGRKIIALGDMLELGKFSSEEHKKVGELVVGCCDILVVVGLRSKHIIEGAMLKGMSEKNIHSFENSEKAGEFLQNEIQENDVVLIKGSQSIRMEKITEELMAEPEKKKELLVRQEAEWLLR